MKILVTGGNTLVPIDKVRAITNIFKGRTGAAIATECMLRGHQTTLIGNQLMWDFMGINPHAEGFTFVPYKTYDELYEAMEREITTGGYDCVIHSAAVSDYKVVRVYGDDEPCFSGKTQTETEVARGGKISSSHKRLIIELDPTEKIVDKIRDPWGFKRILVKFKLQVDMPDEKLLAVAEKSRKTSNADFIVANCLEWSRERAYIIDEFGAKQIKREHLPIVLMDKIDRFDLTAEFCPVSF